MQYKLYVLEVPKLHFVRLPRGPRLVCTKVGTQTNCLSDILSWRQ